MSGTDYTTTPYLALYKPIAGMDVGNWGLHWNANADVLDSALQAHSDSLADGPFLPLAGNKTVTGPVVFNGALTGTAFGTDIGKILGPLINYQGSNLPGLHLAKRLVLDLATTTPSDFAVLQINRTTTFTSSASSLNSVLRLSNTVGTNDGTKNWGFAATQTSAGNQGGQNVGAFIQATRSTGGTDFVLGMVSDARDTTGLVSSAGKQVVGFELDVECNRADNGVNGTAIGGVGIRKGLNIVAMRYNGADTTQTEVSHGILLSASSPSDLTVVDAYTNFQSVLGFAINTQVRNVIDTRGAITPTGSGNPVSAVTMTAGHVIDFNGGASLTSAPGNYLQYRGGKLYYIVGGVDKLSIDASGNVRAAGTITGSVSP